MLCLAVSRYAAYKDKVIPLNLKPLFEAVTVLYAKIKRAGLISPAPFG